MDSYTENDIKKGQAVPDLFVMVSSLHTIHVLVYLLHG